MSFLSFLVLSVSHFPSILRFKILKLWYLSKVLKITYSVCTCPLIWSRTNCQSRCEMRGNELWGCWWWSRRNFISALHCRRAFPFKWIKNNRTGKAWTLSTVWIHFKSSWVLKFETVNRSWVTIIQCKTWCDRSGIKWRGDFYGYYGQTVSGYYPPNKLGILNK